MWIGSFWVVFGRFWAFFKQKKKVSFIFYMDTFLFYVKNALF
jgi:hypothetical protein